jgi:predicted aspartyl protease
MVPFQYVKHVLAIPVAVGDIDVRFILDTGIGVNLISESLASRVGCSPSGATYTGRRMSGQAVTVPIGSAPSLQLGGHRSEDVPFGILDMAAMAGLEGIDGFISLTEFRTTPLTVDYPASRLVIEDEQSLTAWASHGQSVSIDVERDGAYSTDIFLAVDLPRGPSIKVSVDTGSDSLTLSAALAEQAGIDLHAPTTRKHDGRDETGNPFTRYFATMTGDISLTGAPSFRQPNPEVMLQEIIYDGLIGDQFLRNFVTTYDLARSRMIFTHPQ